MRASVWLETARAVGLKPETVRARIKAGWSADRWFVPTFSFGIGIRLRQTWHEEARAAGLKLDTVAHRIKAGWPQNKWFVAPRRFCQSGIVIRSGIVAEARAAGLKYQTVYRRIKSGWPEDRWFVPIPVQDTELASQVRAAGLKLSTVRGRINQGIPKEIALAYPTSASIKTLASVLRPDIKYHTVAERMRRAKETFTQALTDGQRRDPWKNKRKENLVTLAAAAGLSYRTVLARLARGWTRKRALTVPRRDWTKENTLAARARRAGLKPVTVQARIHRYGWSERRALRTPANASQ